MSGQTRSTFRSRKRWDGQKSSMPAGSVVAQQLSGEQCQQDKPSTKSRDITLDQEGKSEGASVVQGPALEATQQELAYPKTGCERGDGPDVKGKKLPNLEPIKLPEGGDGKPQV